MKDSELNGAMNFPDLMCFFVLLINEYILHLWSTQPSVQWVRGALTQGVERPGREADHLPTFSAEVKSSWSCASTPQYNLMA